MATVTFDTLKFAEKLKAAGVPDAQAKAMSEAFRDAQGELEIATKRDLKELELKIETRLEGLRGELTLIKWMLGLLFGGVLALIIRINDQWRIWFKWVDGDAYEVEIVDYH